MSTGTLLITGADGFLGQHIARVAQEQGWRTVGIGRPRSATAIQSLHLDERIEIDLAHADAEARLVEVLSESLGRRDALAGAVVHAAARVQLFGRPAPVIRDNVAMTENVLRAAERAGQPRVILLSSASVLFERRDQLGLREDATPPRRCLNGYAESKRRCEALVAAYAGSHAILRPQAVIGPGDRTLLPPVIDAARSGPWRWIGERDRALTDLLSAQNLAEYCVRAAARPDATGVFHLSDGDALPIEAMFRYVFEALGLEVGERRLPRRVAAALAATIETPMRLLTPRIEPPITAFALEVLTRSRTLDRTRTLAQLGPPTLTVWQGLDRAIDAQRRLL